MVSLTEFLLNFFYLFVATRRSRMALRSALAGLKRILFLNQNGNLEKMEADGHEKVRVRSGIDYSSDWRVSLSNMYSPRLPPTRFKLVM